MLETIFQLDLELAHYDLQIARLLNRRAQIHQRRTTVARRLARREMWVRSWFLDRTTSGHFRLLMDKLLLKDVKAFKNFTRMQPDFFFHILERLRPSIEKQDTTFREAISAAERLAVTLRFYATGERYMSLRYNWLMGDNTISKIVREVSKAIIEVFGRRDEVIKPPTNKEGWLKVAKRFSTRWNFHHTLGAIDGKHIRIKKPPNSGSLYYNYKGFFSIVMLAVVDGNYKFLWVDVGTNGASSDSQIFNDCELKEMIEEDQLCIPPAEPLPGGELDIPYFFIGDDAFALRSFMMKPYCKRDLTKEENVFNYRLSRARRIVENAFGILANRFGCLMTTLTVTPDTATEIVLACCLLHNLLRDANAPIPKGLIDDEDANHDLIPGTFRRECDLTPGTSTCAKNTGKKSEKDQRDYLRDYYSSKYGAVPWQNKSLDAWRK